jgi:predicted DNA-binding transcriptional regulator YafY
MRKNRRLTLKTDYSRLQRWLKIILLLRKGPLSVNEMATHFRVSAKTIRRDMMELENCRMPVCIYKSKCALCGSVPIPEHNGNSAMLRLLSNFLLGESSDKWVERIATIMSEDDDSDELLSVSMPQSSIKPEVLFSLLDAMVHDSSIQMYYLKVGSKKAETRKVFPQKLFFRKQAWYLAGWDYMRCDYRLFRLNRIDDLEQIKKEPFYPNNLENTSQILNNSFGVHVGKPQKIKLLFSEEAAPYIEEVLWHKSQKFNTTESGETEMELFVALDYDLKQWILSFGSGVQVLEPCELAQEICQELQKAFLRYSNSKNKDCIK